MTLQSPWHKAALLAGTALAVRLLCLGAAGGKVALQFDALWYDAFARHLTTGWGWLTTPLQAFAEPEPLYPAFMAFCYALPGPEIGVLQWGQVLLGVATVVVVYLGLRSLTRESVAFTAAFLVALNPHLIFFATLPYRENLIVPLIAASLVLFIRTSRMKRVKLLILATGLFALLIHTDVRFLPLSACIPFVLFAMSRSARSTLRQTAWVWLFLVVLMIPYQVRCYVAHGKPVIVTERFLERWLPLAEKRLRGGTAGETGGDRIDWLRDFEASKMAKLEELSPEEREYFLAGGRPSLNRLRCYWFLFKEYWRFVKFSGTYRPYPDGRWGGVWSARHNVGSSLVMVPFLLFVPFVWLRSPLSERRVAWALLGFLFAHMLLHIAVHSIERYRIPMEVTTSVLTAMGMINVWAFTKDTRAGVKQVA